MEEAIAPALVLGIGHLHRAPVAFDHEAGLRSALRLVVIDQCLAQRRLEDAGHHDHRRVLRRRMRRIEGRKAIEEADQRGDVVTHRFLDRHGGQHTQRGIEHVGHPADAAIGLHHAVQRAYRAVEIPEVAHAPQRVIEALQPLVVRIVGDTEETGVLVAKMRAMGSEIAEHLA
ncbi:hypothetical protein D3C78_1113970 [compost metagenome]